MLLKACAVLQESSASLEGLVVIAGVGPVTKHLADVAVRPLFAGATVVSRVRGRIRQLLLCGTVFCVMEVKTVADVAEEAWRRFLFGFCLGQAADKNARRVIRVKRLGEMSNMSFDRSDLARGD